MVLRIANQCDARWVPKRGKQLPASWRQRSQSRYVLPRRRLEPSLEWRWGCCLVAAGETRARTALEVAQKWWEAVRRRNRNSLKCHACDWVSAREGVRHWLGWPSGAGFLHIRMLSKSAAVTRNPRNLKLGGPHNGISSWGWTIVMRAVRGMSSNLARGLVMLVPRCACRTWIDGRQEIPRIFVWSHAWITAPNSWGRMSGLIRAPGGRPYMRCRGL